MFERTDDDKYKSLVKKHFEKNGYSTWKSGTSVTVVSGEVDEPKYANVLATFNFANFDLNMDVISPEISEKAMDFAKDWKRKFKGRVIYKEVY